MAERPLFPLLFVSGFLLAYYQRALKAGRNDKGALPLLLKSWWLGPRAIPLSGAQRAGIFSYSLALNEDFCSDEMGHSTLLLLEDGKSLPLPHANSIKKIASLGQGRWVHVERKILFSPSDNADLAKTPHQYHLIDGLGGNPEIFGALSKLAQLRASFRNPASYALTKLQLVFGKRLAFSKQKEVDARRLTIDDLKLDLSAAFLPDLSIAKIALEVRPEGTASHIQADLEGVEWAGIRLDRISLAMEIDAAYQPRLIAFSARRDGRNLVELATTTQDGAWRSATLAVAVQEILRRELAATCGGTQAAADWLNGILADLADGTLPMGLNLPDGSRNVLLTALAGDGRMSTLHLEIVRAGQTVNIVARAE